MLRIDAHQHYWVLSRGDYKWLTPALSVLYKDYLPVDLEPILREHGIDRTIVVQAAATEEETQFLLQLAERSESIVGVVGWVDFEGDGFERQLETLRTHPKFIGVRIMLQDEEDPGYVLKPQIVSRLRLLADRDIPVDLLVKSHQLSSIATLVQRIPHLRGVINHIGKPNIADHELNPWKQWVAEIADNPHIYCKLSGMVTEADPQLWTYTDFQDYIHYVLQTFGTHRLMFGSDWPVCLLAASYSQVMDVVNHALPHLTAAERDELFGGNAIRFYKLEKKIGGTL
ncbi:amidohydrolase family protein [Paenibacillus sp. JDR-2]|uniref:amidohydrolase family protein n=1 Tax=Paenibacillus sp. (strain JDR-2) TaxID=324057 RepID=UPI000166BBAF|nr:amidohydrolase family protein [Paenibacillus sp. JDR-2]ACT01855.1 amidohydrolase 2 [Paenibacillus sp. JDR-2]